jgi:hypothetical protein
MTEYYEYRGVQYANGELPKQFQAPLEGNNLALPNDPAVLRADAAESWNRARAEVLAKTGIVLTVRGWNRSLADQEKFFFQRYKAGKASPFGDYRVYKGVRYGRTNGAAAAIPGTSNHGWGLAVDVVDFGGVGQWNHPYRVAAIGILKKHGWTDDEGRGKIQEPWHLVYNPAKDRMKGKPPRTYHRRYATQPLAVREVPGGKLVRTLAPGAKLSVVDKSGKKVGANWYVQTTSNNWVLSKSTAKTRPFHKRVVTRATHVYDRPGRGEGRLLSEGATFTVWDGASVKKGETWWVQTTSGNWVRSASTDKI